MKIQSTILAKSAALCAVGMTLAITAQADNSTWSATSSGNFSDAANWTPGVPGLPAGNTTSTDIATFARGTISATSNVTFDEARNLGGITFDNASAVAGRVFNVQGTTLGAATPALNLSSGFVLQNIGSGTAVSGANMLDVAMVLNGNTTFSNTYGNSVINIGNTTGTSANSINAAADLGAIDLTLTGTSTAGNLLSLRVNQASGTTVRMVKEGTGFWQINGPTATGSNMTGGLLIRQGGVSIGRSSTLSIGSGAIVVGDGTTTAGDLRISTGSSVTVSNNITVADSLADNVYFERGGGGGAGSFSGNINIAQDLTLRQGTTANQVLNLTAASTVTGSGNLIINTTVASAGAVNLSGSVNMTGRIINQSTTGTGNVTISGAIGSNVTGLIQNSATSNMVLSNAGNAYTGNTTITAGTLFLSGGGDLGSSNLVLNGGILNITAITGASYTMANTISGNGTIVTTGKDFVAQGTIAPGASFGEINVTGNFTFDSTAIANFEIGGTGAGFFDELLATGLLTYNGTLNLTTSYAAANGDTVKLFHGSSYSGVFSSITGTDLGGGLSWDTSQLAVDGTITVVPEPATSLLLAGAAGMFFLLRRRRRSS